MSLQMILTLGWVLILFIWIVTDPRVLKERVKDKIWITYAVVFFILLPQLLSSLYFPIPAGRVTDTLELFGVGLYSAGFIISMWAKYEMRDVWAPPGKHDIARQNVLLTKGPFTISRHPIYLGMFFLTLGYGLALHSWFFWLGFLLLYYFMKEATKEEILLRKYFGKQYDEYAKKVPKLLGVGELMK